MLYQTLITGFSWHKNLSLEVKKKKEIYLKQNEKRKNEIENLLKNNMLEEYFLFSKSLQRLFNGKDDFLSYALVKCIDVDCHLDGFKFYQIEKQLTDSTFSVVGRILSIDIDPKNIVYVIVYEQPLFHKFFDEIYVKNKKEKSILETSDVFMSKTKNSSFFYKHYFDTIEKSIEEISSLNINDNKKITILNTYCPDFNTLSLHELFSLKNMMLWKFYEQDQIKYDANFHHQLDKYFIHLCENQLNQKKQDMKKYLTHLIDVISV